MDVTIPGYAWPYLDFWVQQTTKAKGAGAEELRALLAASAGTPHEQLWSVLGCTGTLGVGAGWG